MAEVAGTAVGIISLGIQVCQGLVSYYQDYKGQDEKVGDILRDVLTLSNTLEAIQNCLSKLNSSQLDTIAQAEDSIMVCAAAVTRLNQLLAKCRQTAVPADFKERIQVLTRKAAFPFCQSTIKDLKDAVKGLRTNVVIALQALQVELSTYLPDYTSEILNCTTSTFAGITRVRNDVSGLSAQIHDIHSSLPELKNDTRGIAQTVEQMLPSIQQSSTRIATDLTRVDRSVSTLNQQISTLGSGLEQNFSILGQTIDRLPGVLEDKILTMLEVYFNRQAHSIASKCSSVDTMALQANNLQVELLRKPSLLRSVCDSVVQVEHFPNELSKKGDRRPPSEFALSEVPPPSMALCSCKIGSTYESRNWSTRSLNLFRSSAISCIHQKGCPLRIPPRKKMVIGMKYSHCGLLLSRMLYLSLSITCGAGGSSISPNLTFRATVSCTSPAFALFDNGTIKSMKHSGSYCKWATQELYRLFREQKASPSDVNSCGETLLHVACEAAVSILDSEAYDTQRYRGLILSLRDWGVEFNETDIEGKRPLDVMIGVGVLAQHHRGLMSMGLGLLDSGFEFSDSWWLVQNSVSKEYWDNYHRHIAMCLVGYRSVDEVVDGLQCGRLSRAILLRSETQVSQLVEIFPDCLREKNSVGHTPMHLAASWPAGISILLEAGAKNLVNEPDNVGFLPLAYASYSKCLAAVQLLMDADCALYTDGPAVVNNPTLNHRSRDVLWDAIRSSSEEVVKCIVQALADRRRRLAAIASRELPPAVRKRFDLSPDKVLDASAARVYNLLKENNILLPHSLLVPSGWQTIYHVLFQGDEYDINPLKSLTKWTDIFYDAGFHEFVGFDEFGENLLMVKFDMPILPRLTAAVEFFSWLLRKGLRLGHKSFRRNDDGDYIPHTPAAFYVGRWIISMIGEPEVDWDSTMEMELRYLLTEVVDERTPDDCRCACSLDCCCAITAMLKEIARVCSKKPGRALYDYTIWLVNLLDIANDGWSFFSANIIRFLTFERLEPTHTCCVWQGRLNNYFAIFDDNDRIEIQEEESVDLNELVKLMLEFTHAYADLSVPLPEFLQGYWMTRMDEVMSGEEAMNEDEARRIRELGVTWEPREQRSTLPPFSSISRPREDGDVIFSPRIENVRKRRNSC